VGHDDQKRRIYGCIVFGSSPPSTACHDCFFEKRIPSIIAVELIAHYARALASLAANS
jgi:hypothetical protein